MIAVIKTGGKQYTVKAKDKIKVEKISKPEGSKVNFDEVLLLADKTGKQVKIGQPKVSQASVEGKILKHDRADKVTVIKYKNKTRYRRVIGHRQAFTLVEIEKVSLG